MNRISALIILLTALISSGCLVFEQADYVIKIGNDGKGTAEITIRDLRSDAMLDSEFAEDKTNLFDYIYKSNEFAASMVAEGKPLKSRELFIEGETLIGRTVYEFTDINRVEGIVYEEGFYFLTLESEDSIRSTNGQIIISENYKRILWDDEFNELRFSLYKGLPEKTKPLAPFLKK